MTGNQAALKELEFLREQGDELIRTWSEQEDIAAVRIWVAAVKDFFDALPDHSALNNELVTMLEERSQGLSFNSDSPDPENVLMQVEDINRVLRCAVEYFPRLSFTDSLKRSRAKKEQELEYEEIASRMEPKEAEIRQKVMQDFTDKMWLELMKTYTKSPVFLVPFILLSAAVIFALFSIFRIQSYELNLQQLTNQAVERSKVEIDQNIQDIRQDLTAYSVVHRQSIADESEAIRIALNNYADTQRGLIDSQTARKVDEIVQSKGPDIADIYIMTGSYAERLKTLETKIQLANLQADALEDRLIPMERAAQAFDQNQIPITGAMTVLGNSSLILIAAAAAAVLSLILSTVAFARTFRR